MGLHLNIDFTTMSSFIQQSIPGLHLFMYVHWYLAYLSQTIEMFGFLFFRWRSLLRLIPLKFSKICFVFIMRRSVRKEIIKIFVNKNFCNAWLICNVFCVFKAKFIFKKILELKKINKNYLLKFAKIIDLNVLLFCKLTLSTMSIRAYLLKTKIWNAFTSAFRLWQLTYT